MFHNVQFYRALQGQPFPAKCLVELQMIKTSSELRKKPNWFEKIQNPVIAAKWKAEIIEQGLSAEAAKFVIEEAKYYATLREGGIEPGPIDGTWIAENLIEDTLLKRFKSLVGNLENIPAEEKDYHPGSNGLVVNIVHPSMYCYVEGRSVLINKETITPLLLPPPTSYESRTFTTSKHRWMPAEVSFGEDDSVQFDSYINNLHPLRHNELYISIGKIFKRFLALFNKSLTDVANNSFRVRVDLTYFDWHGDEQFEGDEEDDEAYNLWERTRPILPIPISDFVRPAHPAHVIDLNGKKLQVIVKIANIELTPENPKYEGGNWHVEGVSDERIVATGIYYFEMENISETKLLFRQRIDHPHYEQYDLDSVFAVYGMAIEGVLNQALGHITAQPGLCIVFPNIYQHRVAPFELLNKTKPGFRKTLVFFLVDPTV